MPISLQINKIEDSKFTETTYSGDGSFDLELEKAKAKISKQKNKNTQWDQLESLLNVIPLSIKINGPV